VARIKNVKKRFLHLCFHGSAVNSKQSCFGSLIHPVWFSLLRLVALFVVLAVCG